MHDPHDLPTKLLRKRKGAYRSIVCVPPHLRSYYRRHLPYLTDLCQALEKHYFGDRQVLHGFMPGRSAVTNAQTQADFPFHRYNRAYLSMDLKDFFDHVTRDKLSEFVPADILDEVLIDGIARQGLPTSPVLANIAALPMDVAITSYSYDYLVPAGTYTRYADDMTMSCRLACTTGKEYAHTRQVFEQRIIECAVQHGFSVNHAKTRWQVLSPKNSVHITGVALQFRGTPTIARQADVRTTRHSRRKLRAIEHRHIHKLKRRSKKQRKRWLGMIEWCCLKLPKPVVRLRHLQRYSLVTPSGLVLTPSGLVLTPGGNPQARAPQASQAPSQQTTQTTQQSSQQRRRHLDMPD
jgi:hypothetical protein